MLLVVVNHFRWRDANNEVVPVAVLLPLLLLLLPPTMMPVIGTVIRWRWRR
jgi:hypothetical protein